MRALCAARASAASAPGHIMLPSPTGDTPRGSAYPAPNSVTRVSTVLTSFNDNAMLAYLATLVPNFSDGMKYAIIAGAVSGGGLTIIANAPNPAGQAILDERFGNHGIAPVTLLRAALLPTAIIAWKYVASFG